jgi:hypothetical protein
MDRWGGAPAVKLMAIIRNLAVTWHGNMWANINRSGHGNEYHSHPGAYWSAVYYVDDGGIADDPSLGGELEFMDPRGPLPAINAPHLGVAMAGGLTAGATERVQPKSGRLTMFPAWMMHQTRPYRGTAERISIAMNLSLWVPGTHSARANVTVEVDQAFTCPPSQSIAACAPPLPCGMPRALSPTSITLSVPRIIGALT